MDSPNFLNSRIMNGWMLSHSFRLPLALMLMILISGSLPALAATPATSVSYNPAGAAKYHAPISQMGLIAITRSYSLHPTSLQAAGTPATVSVAPLLPSGLTRFINDSSYMPQTETSVAVDPSTPSHVVGGYNDGRFFFCPDLKAADCPSGYTESVTGFTTSADGGASVAKSDDLPGVIATEKNLTSGASSSGFLLSWGDPSVAAAPGGKFYFASLAFDPVTGANGIMLEVSNSGLWDPANSCTTPLSTPETNSCWTAKLVFANLSYQCLGPGVCGTFSFEDKETISVDMNSNSPTFGDVYVSWDHFFASGKSASYVAVCTPALTCTMISGGSATPVSGSDPFAGFSTVTVAPDGTVYAAWCNFGTATTLGPVSCEERSSPAGGLSFGALHTIFSFMGAGTTIPGDSAIQGFATEQFRASSELTVAAGASGAVYFAVPICVSGAYFQFQSLFLAGDNPGNCGSSAVFFARSTNGGADWSAPTQVSQQGVMIQPSLAVDPTSGAVVLAYYSSQFDLFSHRLDVVAAVSLDQGQTFNSTRLTWMSDEPNADPSQFDYISPFGGALVVPQFGDYITATAYGGKVYVLFTGNYALEGGTYQTDPFLVVAGETQAALRLGSNSADAAPGDTVSYSLAGLSPGSTYTVTLNWGGIQEVLSSGTVAANGRASGNLTVPNVQSQVYTVVASDANGLSASSQLGVGQVSLNGVQSTLADLKTSVASLRSALTALGSSLSAQFSSLNSSVSTSVGAAASGIDSSVSKLGSSLTGPSSTLSLVEYLVVIAVVLLIIVIALSLRGRSKPASAQTPQPAPAASPQPQP